MSLHVFWCWQCVCSYPSDPLILTAGFRDVQGLSAKFLQNQLGYGEDGGLYAEFDDGNPAWEDVEFDMWDPKTEAIWRQDDIANGEGVEDTTNEDVNRSRFRNRQKAHARYRMVIFRHWQQTW